MKSIVHISDLHFGTENDFIKEALLDEIYKIMPKAVAISGDLTQRARTAQFIKAKEYIDRIKFPKVVIPGNHDISLFNPYKRFVNPLYKYKKYITDEMYPHYTDKDFSLIGINSARSLTWKSGRISLEQIEEIKSTILSIGSSLFKAVVIHHNLYPTPHNTKQNILGRTEILLDEIDECGIDLILSGHRHFPYTAILNKNRANKSSSVYIAAGTAFSTRTRNYPNSFNLLKLHYHYVENYTYCFCKKKFIPVTREIFTRDNHRFWVASHSETLKRIEY